MFLVCLLRCLSFVSLFAGFIVCDCVFQTWWSVLLSLYGCGLNDCTGESFRGG